MSSEALQYLEVLAAADRFIQAAEAVAGPELTSNLVSFSPCVGSGAAAKYSLSRQTSCQPYTKLRTSASSQHISFPL